MLFKRINLEFFKGGSTTTQVEKRDPKSAQHVAMDNSIYGLLSPLAARYGGTSVLPNITTTKITQPEPNYSNSYYGVNQGGYNRQGDYTGNGQYDASGRRVNYGRTPSPQQTTTIQSQTPNLAGFNESQLGKNFDIADAQKSLVDANTLNLLANNGSNLNLSQNALRNMESLANNYVNPYSTNDFTNMNNNMLNSQLGQINLSNNAYGKAESLANNYVNPFSTQDMRNNVSAVNNLANNYVSPYGKSDFDAQNTNMMGDISGYLQAGNRDLASASQMANNYADPYQKSEFNPYISKMDASATGADRFATKYYDDADWYLNQNKELASKGTNQGLSNLMSEVYKSINNNFVKDASALIADAASRGVVNSTTGNRAMQGLSDSASSAAGEQYMSGFQSLLNNALSGAQTSDALAQNVVSTADKTNQNYANIINSMLGINSGALNTLQGKAGILQNNAQGYNQSAGTVQNAYNSVLNNMLGLNADSRDTMQTQAGVLNNNMNSMVGANENALNTMQGRAGVYNIAGQGYGQNAGIVGDSYNRSLNSMLGVNENALGTMQGRANVLGNASQGYNRDYTTGLQGLETMAKLPSRYYQNALAPISPLYNYWKDMTDAYYGHEDYDTVVSSNGK